MTTRPKWLKPSAMVDLRQTLMKLRPAFRTEIEDDVTNAELSRWARSKGLYYCRDRHNFVVFSPRPELVRWILTIDQSAGEHCAWLGMWLGYPPCCVRAARRAGEAQLDAWAARISKRRHIGTFRHIGVSGYPAGNALISHIPCSPHCSPSLRLATAMTKRSLPPR
ncbi:MAG: hypothetical protein EKK31_02220 [Hyphomicrobiales bacterium]|nr:MAG: hypothetical protein EKK31_02220 [Hyphomicrobiales bacterium]